MTLYIDREKIMPEDAFAVTDESGQVVFKVISKKEKSRMSIFLYNSRGESIASVQERRSLVSSEYCVFFGEALYARIKTSASLFAKSVEIDGVDGKLTVDGSIENSSYTVYKDGSPAGSLRRRWFENRKSGLAYCIGITSDEDAAFLVAVILTIEICVR